ncbi:MAG: uroporphyrinogen-III C-methyltransferase [Planctomycetes bacterium]|nr:uroporphyrinogen-III C-methyltransferase [Planctomycetota bacterium]
MIGNVMKKKRLSPETSGGGARARGSGKVFVAGAGPGHPGYLTLRAVEALRAADVVVYDNLVSEAALGHVPPGALRIYAGKRPGRHSMKQEEISRLLVELARKHRTVVRLKGGDPLIFGRGAEEAEALAAAGVPFEIVPGVSAAQGCGATAGVPLTRRGFNESVTFATGHEDPEKGGSTLDFGALARSEHLVLYMGVGRLRAIAGKLVGRGMAPGTPAAVVASGTLPGQRTVRAPLASIADATERAGVEPPALVFVGPNAAPGLGLDWFESRPLFGRTVAVVRSRAQASTLSAALEELGARALEFPVIRIEPVAGAELRRVDRAVRSLRRWDWVLFASVTGVDLVRERLAAAGLDARAFGNSKAGAIGPATAERLRGLGIVPDFVPAKYTTADFADGLVSSGIGRGSRVLLARARLGEPELAAALKRSGAAVTDLPLYDTLPLRGGEAEMKKALREGRIHAVAFTSSSTARHFLDRVGPRNFRDFSRKALYASIGPATSAQLRALGAEPGVEASEHTIPGLVRAIEEALSAPPGPGGGEKP